MNLTKEQVWDLLRKSCTAWSDTGLLDLQEKDDIYVAVFCSYGDCSGPTSYTVMTTPIKGLGARYGGRLQEIRNEVAAKPGRYTMYNTEDGIQGNALKDCFTDLIYISAR